MQKNLFLYFFRHIFGAKIDLGCMAKGNFILGQVTGSVGDITFWRTGGEQLSRSRNRRPANPRTTPQLLSRVYLKTASLAYSVLAYNFGNQTFQGATIGAENQRRFLSRNIQNLRTRVENGEEGDMNFAGKNTVNAPLNRYVVSEGSLTDPLAVIESNGVELQHPIAASGSIPTYAEVCAGLGLPAGAQLTFVTIGKTNDGLMGAVYRSRIILSPSDGDMSTPFIVGGNINKPNIKNEYSTVTAAVTFSSDLLRFALLGNMMAVACVASYNENGNWRYSTSQLWFNPTVYPGVLTLADAVESWRTTAESSEYTRQANESATGTAVTKARYRFSSKGDGPDEYDSSSGDLSTVGGDENELICLYPKNEIQLKIRGVNLNVNDVSIDGVPSGVHVLKRYEDVQAGNYNTVVVVDINQLSFNQVFPSTYPLHLTISYGEDLHWEFNLIEP